MKAWELLSSPEKWTQGSNAVNDCGKEVAVANPAACQWCVAGAIRKCYPDLDSVGRIALGNKILAAAAAEKDGHEFLVAWNDRPGRTWEEVRDALVKANV